MIAIIMTSRIATHHTKRLHLIHHAWFVANRFKPCFDFTVLTELHRELKLSRILNCSPSWLQITQPCQICSLRQNSMTGCQQVRPLVWFISARKSLIIESYFLLCNHRSAIVPCQFLSWHFAWPRNLICVATKLTARYYFIIFCESWHV